MLLRWRIRAVLPHIRGRLIDIGCGTNELVRAYSGDGIGVDVYPWPGADQVVEDTARLPLPDESFDTATIVAALNHIPNRREVLREVHRVLRRGGRLIVTMIPPGISRVWHAIRSPWDVDQSERGMKDGEVYGLDRSAVRALLADAGFRFESEHAFMLGVNRITIGSRSADAPMPAGAPSPGRPAQPEAAESHAHQR